MWAAWKNHLELINVLLAIHGVDVNETNRDGMTALHWAAKRGSFQASRLLISGSADLNIVDEAGKTALQIAQQRGFVELAQLLENETQTFNRAQEDGAEDKPMDVLMFEEMTEGGLGQYQNKEDQLVATDLGYGSVRMFTVTRSGDEKVGFRLQSSKEHSGTFARKILPNGAAARSGEIRDGDLIIAVQGSSIFERTHHQIIEKIKQAGDKLHIAIVKPEQEDLDFLRFVEVLVENPNASLGEIGPANARSAANIPARVESEKFTAEVPADVNTNKGTGPPKPGRKDTLVIAGQEPPQEPVHEPAQEPAVEKPQPSELVKVAARSPTPVTPEEPIVISQPDFETSTHVSYKIQNVVLSKTSVLRLVLPVWACTRVLRHIRITHRKCNDGWKTCESDGESNVTDRVPVYQNVKVWGCRLLAHSATSGVGEYLVPGSTAMLHGFLQSELDGHLGTVLAITDDGKFDIQLKGTGYRLITTVDHLRVIHGDACWWEYGSSDIQHGSGAAVPFRSPGVAFQTDFSDWNTHVGVIHAGAMEIVTIGEGRYGCGVVEKVEVELFPERIPAYIASTSISVNEQAFNPTCKFCPLFAGAAGLESATQMADFERIDSDGEPSGTLQIGRGWVRNGQDYWPDLPIAARDEADCSIQNGLLRIPLSRGLRLLMVEVAVAKCSPSQSSSASQCQGATVSCKLSRHPEQPIFEQVLTSNTAIFSGGPPTNDFVSLETDAIEVDCATSPVWILGYRLTTCAADAALVDINVLRQMKLAEISASETKAKNHATEMALKNLLVDERRVQLDTSHKFEIGVGTFGQTIRASYDDQDFAFKPALCWRAEDAAFWEAASIARVGAVSLFSNHPNIAPYVGVCKTTAGKSRDAQCSTASTVYIMQELFPQSLRQVLNKNELRIEQQLQILCGVCSGMYYLHSRCPEPIFHGRLKASNVMLRSDLTPCVSDFGLSTTTLVVGETAQMHKHDASFVAWMAPEYVLDGSAGRLTEAGDIYAFGMLMYEITTCGIPWDGLESRVVMDKTLQGKRPALTPTSEMGSHLCRWMMQSCWQQVLKYIAILMCLCDLITRKYCASYDHLIHLTFRYYWLHSCFAHRTIATGPRRFVALARMHTKSYGLAKSKIIMSWISAGCGLKESAQKARCGPNEAMTCFVQVMHDTDYSVLHAYMPKM